MKFLKWIKICLSLTFLLLSATAMAQEATIGTDFPSCESDRLNDLLFIVHCEQDHCPFAQQQHGLYELICPSEGFGRVLGEDRFYKILENIDKKAELPAAKNISTLSPCDCLTKLEEKFQCDIDSCEVKQESVPAKTPIESAPSTNPELSSGGCSLSDTQISSTGVPILWAAILLGIFILSRESFGKSKLAANLGD